MDIPVDLHVLAQVSITIAGFTGIIGTLQQREGRTFTVRQKAHLVNLLQCTTIVAFASFIPTYFATIPNAGDDVFRWSIRALLVVHIAAWAIAIPVVLKQELLFGPIPQIERICMYIIMATGVVAVFAEIAVVLGHYEEYSMFLFESVMLFFLAIAVFDFIALLVNPEI